MILGEQELRVMLLWGGATLLKVGAVIAVVALLIFYLRHRKK